MPRAKKATPKHRRSRLALNICAGLTLAVALNIAMRPGSSIDPGTASGSGGDEQTVDVTALASDVDLVAAIQRELTAQGYAPGPADGAISLPTRAAVLAYETDIGRPLTGMPSESVLKALLFGTTIVAKALQPAHVTAEGREVIREVESSLAAAGYAPGAVDGKLDASTANAIKRFEADQGLKPSGRISADLVRRLANARSS